MCTSQKNLLQITSSGNTNTKSKSLMNVQPTGSQQTQQQQQQQQSAQVSLGQTSQTNSSQQLAQSPQVQSPSGQQQQQQKQQPLPMSVQPAMDKNEKLMLKKYARYSKQSPKSVSAVLRQPTLTNSKTGHQAGGQSRRYQHTINKQTSLSQLVLSKLSASNASKLSSATTSKCMSTVGEAVAQSQPDSIDTPTQEHTPALAKLPESSAVSSKISLFKKTVT